MWVIKSDLDHNNRSVNQIWLYKTRFGIQIWLYKSRSGQIYNQIWNQIWQQNTIIFIRAGLMKNPLKRKIFSLSVSKKILLAYIIKKSEREAHYILYAPLTWTLYVKLLTGIWPFALRLPPFLLTVFNFQRFVYFAKATEQ